ncbi:MAG TPA: hypothetical protein PKM47_03550 [Mycobacterium sp.]|nr:hypothetical protein [Mycobacterium sp.]
MKVGRKTPTPDDRKRNPKRKPAPARRGTPEGATRTRRTAEPAPRAPRQRPGAPARREPRGLRQGPQTAPTARPAERQARPKTASQAKARSKARKAKAPKVVRPPLRERLIARLAAVDLRPQRLVAKVPFVVLVIGALGVGLGVTLWLSTDAAQRSYQLGTARATNEALSQQKEALERDVREAQSAPALSDAARNLGMIPSKDTAHLVQDPTGNWIVVGKPKPAEGAPPPPLNSKLPDEKPPAPPTPAAPAPKPGSLGSVEVPVRTTPLVPGAAPLVPGATPPVPGLAPLTPGVAPLVPGATALVPGTAPLVPGAAPLTALPSPTDPGAAHAPAGTLPGPAQTPGPAPLTQPLNVPGPADVVPTAPQVLPALTPVVPAAIVPMAGAAQ